MQTQDLSKVKTRLKLITPEFAAGILLKTDTSMENGFFSQRPISQHTVDRYIRDIKLGAWLVSPQTITLDTEGLIIDGRHRLTAIVQSGVPVMVNLSTGWPKTQTLSGGLTLSTIDGIDRGRARSVGSQLTICHGIKSANNVAASMKSIAELCVDQKHISVSVPQVLLLLEIYEESMRAIVSHTKGTRDWRSYICGPIIFFHASNPKDAEIFASKLFGMEGLSSGHPALTLIKWVQNHQRAASQDRNDTAKVIFSCLRAFAEGRKISKVYSSQEAWFWATSLQKENVRKVRQIVGVK